MPDIADMQRTRPGESGGIDAAWACQVAASLHRQGKLQEAERLYRRVLRVEPDRFAALCGLGSIHRQQGRLAAAAALFRHAAGIAVDSADAQVNLGIALGALGCPKDAAGCFARALVVKEDDADVHSHLADALSALDRSEEAVRHYRRAIAIDPARAQAHCNLGIALAARGRTEEAIGHYRQTLVIKPDHAEAHNNLGNALRMLGRIAEAASHYQRALAINPALPQAHCNLGLLVEALDGPAAAIVHYRRALAIKPDLAEAHINLGNVLRMLNRHQEAIVHFAAALAIRPGLAELHNNLGISLHALGRNAEAMAQYEQALAIRADYAEVHNNLAAMLHSIGRFEDAIAHCRQALAVKPDHAEAHNNLGVTLQGLGRLEEAGAAYGRAVELSPRKAEFHLNLAYSRRFEAGDKRLTGLERLANDLASLSEHDQIALRFALGKAYADLGQHERSFQHLLAGNALKRRQFAYDEAATLKRFERIRTVFTRELMRQQHGGDPSPVPVFVVGMPRSGTTLIEQILASHSGVFGAGERDDLGTAALALKTSKGAPAEFPEVVSTMSGEQLRELGAGYLARLRSTAPDAKRIVDKMPSNFTLVGLIHLVLPNARIIHARRDPVDTCLSCFSILFTGEHPHAYDLGELGRFYRAYEALMEHWREVLPEGVMIEVQYEDIVDDLEGQARRIVTHCGLDWEEACLGFHATERPVLTASASQVRQRIYRSSVGRWRPYGQLLEPLLTALQIVPPPRD